MTEKYVFALKTIPIFTYSCTLMYLFGIKSNDHLFILLFCLLFGSIWYDGFLALENQMPFMLHRYDKFEEWNENSVSVPFIQKTLNCLVSFHNPNFRGMFDVYDHKAIKLIFLDFKKVVANLYVGIRKGYVRFAQLWYIQMKNDAEDFF